MLKVSEYRELYEGLTQEDGRFRDHLYERSGQTPQEELFPELERAKNRINYAMLGIHPIYQREVELSGIVDYPNKTLYLYDRNGQTKTPFSELDPSYVQFLESQKRIYNVKETLPLSSVALKTSSQMLSDEGVRTPDTEGIPMNLPSYEIPYSRKVLETAFTRSMVLMNHLHEEIEKYGLDRAYGTSREDLIKYVESNSFHFGFEHSVNELADVAKDAVILGGLEEQ